MLCRPSFLWCVFMAGAVAAEDPPMPWRWSNPLPHGNNVYDQAVRDGTYWQVTDRGQVYASSDRLHWNLVASGTTNALRGIAFTDAQVILCGAAGTLLRGSLADGFDLEPLSPPTTDWLEAVAASPNVAVAVGDNAAIYRSTGSGAWLRVTGLSFSNWLRGVAFGNNTFVAVGEDGHIATSADGTSWLQRSSGTTSALNRVFFVEDKFVAVGDAGSMLISLDSGANWQRITTGTSVDLYGFAEGTPPIGSRQPWQLLVGDNAMLLRSAPDGSWNDQLGDGSPMPAPVWPYYAAVWDGERFVVAGQTGMVIQSLDFGANSELLWFESSGSARDWLWDVVALPEQYLAVGDRGTVLSSADGINWFREGVPKALEDTLLLGVGGTTNLVVAAGSDGGLMWSQSEIVNILETNTVIDFIDCSLEAKPVVQTNQMDLLGLVWHAVDPRPTTNTLQGVCERDGLFVVVGDQGTILSSTNGSNWTRQVVAAAPNFSSVTAWAGGFLATGDRGAIYASEDGRTWQARTSGTTNWVYRVRATPAGLVAVGQNGLLLTSPDGVEWTTRSTGTMAWLTDVAHVEGQYCVSGAQGTLLSSADGIDWQPLPIQTGKSLYGLGARRGQLLAVGVEGLIMRALPTALDDVQVVDYKHCICDQSHADYFRFAGRIEQKFGLEASTNLTAWQPVADFVFAEEQLDYWLVRTNSPRPASEFFRTIPKAP
jgi:hypothetical protein